MRARATIAHLHTRARAHSRTQGQTGPRPIDVGGSERVDSAAVTHVQQVEEEGKKEKDSLLHFWQQSFHSRALLLCSECQLLDVVA